MSLIEILIWCGMLGVGILGALKGYAHQAGPWGALGIFLGVVAFQYFGLRYGTKFVLSKLPQLPRCVCGGVLREVGSRKVSEKIALLSCTSCDARYLATLSIFGNALAVFAIRGRLEPYRCNRFGFWGRCPKSLKAPSLSREWETLLRDE